MNFIKKFSHTLRTVNRCALISLLLIATQTVFAQATGTPSGPPVPVGPAQPAPPLNGSGWTVTYSGGTEELIPYGNGSSSLSPGNQTFDYFLSNGIYGGGGNFDSGTITATFTWNDPSVTPPDYVYVLETCTATGTGDNISSVAASADDGFLDTPTSTTTTLQPGYTQTSASCQGTRITSIALGGSTSFVVTCTPSASGGVNASIAYTAAVTTKALTIDCSLDATFHKGDDGSPVSNVTSQATPRFGDTWVDPSTDQPDPAQNSGIYQIFPTFTAVPLGSWGSRLSHSWNAAGQVFSDNLINTYTSIEPTEWTITGDQLKQMGISGPTTFPVTLTIVDNDNNGASVSAVYKLRVHNEYDNWHEVRDLGIQPPSEVQVVVAEPGYATEGGSVSCTWNEQDVEWSDLTASETSLTAVTSSIFENPFFDAAFAVLGIAEGQLTHNYTMSANFDSCWRAEYSTITGSWNDNKNLYEMTPQLLVGYDEKLESGDQYGASGFVGEVPNVVGVKATQQFCGNFTLINPTP